MRLNVIQGGEKFVLWANKEQKMCVAKLRKISNYSRNSNNCKEPFKIP